MFFFQQQQKRLKKADHRRRLLLCVWPRPLASPRTQAGRRRWDDLGSRSSSSWCRRWTGQLAGFLFPTVNLQEICLQLTCRLALTDLDSAAAYFALYKLLQSAGTCLGEKSVSTFRKIQKYKIQLLRLPCQPSLWSRHPAALPRSPARSLNHSPHSSSSKCFKSIFKCSTNGLNDIYMNFVTGPLVLLSLSAFIFHVVNPLRYHRRMVLYSDTFSCAKKTLRAFW